MNEMYTHVCNEGLCIAHRVIWSVNGTGFCECICSVFPFAISINFAPYSIHSIPSDRSNDILVTILLCNTTPFNFVSFRCAIDAREHNATNGVLQFNARSHVKIRAIHFRKSKFNFADNQL